MRDKSNLVLAVFAANFALSLAGFALVTMRFGADWLGQPAPATHAATGLLWLLMMFAQIFLARRRHPAHKIVGRLALLPLGLMVYLSAQNIFENMAHIEQASFEPSIYWVFAVTGMASLVYAAGGIVLAVNKQFRAHSVAMLLTGAITMAAGVARAAGAFEAMLGLPFQVTYALSAGSMALVLHRWRPDQFYLTGSYAALMACVIFIR